MKKKENKDQKKNTNKILYLILLVLAVAGAVLVYYLFGNKDVSEDAKKFSSEYTLVDEDNVFKYSSMKEIRTILDNGTGIVYFGFPTCPWCQAYVKYLNEVAKDNDIDTIYYYNIYEDRKNNTEDYKAIVERLRDYLFNDDEGNKRIMVPDVTYVKNGKIVAHDNQTSNFTEGVATEYYTNKIIKAFKETTKKNIEALKYTCQNCNN